MPLPAPVPVLSIEKDLTLSNVSVVFDASVFKVWRDETELGISDPKHPYWAMDIHIAGWPAYSSTLLARYSGSKLVKGALYQLRGRFFVTNSRLGQESYLHVDEAIRFQGPGTIRSIKKPQFLMVADVAAVNETDIAVSWITKDPYRRNTIHEQNAVISVEGALPNARVFQNQKCALEGRMESADHRQGWVCSGISLC